MVSSGIRHIDSMPRYHARWATELAALEWVFMSVAEGPSHGFTSIPTSIY